MAFNKAIPDINSRSLIVYELLLKACSDCEQAAPPYKNLGMLFFHVLQQFFSAYIFRKLESETGLQVTEFAGVVNNEFPYWDYRSLDKGLDHSACRFPTFPPSNRWGQRFSGRIASRIGLLGRRFGRTVGVLPTFLQPRKLGLSLLGRGHRLTFPSYTGIGDAAFNDQWPILERALEPVFDLLQMSAASRQASRSILASYIRAWITEDETGLQCDVLVSGSMLTLENRLLAAQARAQSIPVVVPIHGDADGFLDEPWSGYGEATYPTHLVSFGSMGDELRRFSRYARSILHDETPRTMPASSNLLVENIWRPNRPIRSAGSLSNIRLLYLPTCYEQFLGYGPFHSIPDALYREWQRAVLLAFPGTTIKEHPVNIMRGLRVSNTGPQDLRPLPKALADYDAYIIDYISTGSNLAMATDKPVIYFDLGIRNPTPAALSAIKQRCITVEPTDMDPIKLRQAVLDQLKFEKSDAFTPKFCVTESRQPREELVSELIGSL